MGSQTLTTRLYLSPIEITRPLYCHLNLNGGFIPMFGGIFPSFSNLGSLNIKSQRLFTVSFYTVLLYDILLQLNPLSYLDYRLYPQSKR